MSRWLWASGYGAVGYGPVAMVPLATGLWLWCRWLWASGYGAVGYGPLAMSLCTYAKPLTFGHSSNTT
jgi:hypothetical protein